MMRIPDRAELFRWIPPPAAEAVAGIVEQVLLMPLREFLARPSKRFRAQLVLLGFHLARTGDELSDADRGRCERAAEVLECLHAASLVVDDIQDGSASRRGGPALHAAHGVPTALNAGNWLYFWPLDGVREWGLDADRENAVYRACHRALLQAHFGQAVDVGTGIDRVPWENVRETVLAAIRLKSGALIGLAMGLGAILAGADSGGVAALESFGVEFGVALQILDDAGNASAKGKDDGKQFEDLRLRRPGWLWVVAAGLPGVARDGFRTAVEALPDETALRAWLSDFDALAIARHEASVRLEQALAHVPCAGESGGVARAELAELTERLLSAYD